MTGDSELRRPAWWRRRGWVVASVVVAAAVAVSVVVFVRGDSEIKPIVQIEPAVMRYRPGWLPNDSRIGQMSEYSRRVDGPSQIRRWTDMSPGHLDSTHVDLLVLADAQLPPGEAVTVGGAAGTLSTKQSEGTIVAWRVASGEQLRVLVWGDQELRDPARVALDIAKSVVPDGQSVLLPPARFGWLPTGLRPGPLQVDGRSPTDFGVELVAEPVSPDARRIGVWIMRERPTQYLGNPISLRGTQGWYLEETRPKARPAPAHGRVTVELGDGRWLSADGQVSKDVLVRVLDTLDVAAATTHPWIGTR
jgi:hypothetical protein